VGCGSRVRAGAVCSYVDLEALVPAAHPLRAIRAIVNQGARCGTTRPSRRVATRLLAGDVAAEFLAALLKRPKWCVVCSRREGAAVVACRVRDQRAVREVACPLL
jgi:hypothetical protein